MINICIPETRWTYRVWLHIRYRRHNMWDRGVWLEFITNGHTVRWFDYMERQGIWTWANH